jgi:hypothetical protein
LISIRQLVVTLLLAAGNASAVSYERVIGIRVQANLSTKGQCHVTLRMSPTTTFSDLILCAVVAQLDRAIQKSPIVDTWIARSSVLPGEMARRRYR